MKKCLLIVLIAIQALNSFSQQTIKGKVVDKESKFPLPGVSVAITTTDPIIGGVTDIDGNFKVGDVPVGRHTVKVSFTGYAPQNIPIVVSSAKEVVLNVEIEESTEMLNVVEINAGDDHEVNNEMAVVSSRVFSVEETERYAGSRGDPARMASNFAGVSGADDSRNDIVVRGNSPLGVVYRVEGIDIPNPNHFAISGSTGGPVSILNNKLLSNSDFFTGAFPAEYGNSTAGVFDLKLRNGNNEKHEFTGQFGFLGTEIMAEGPLSKKHTSSYLVMYRYSTVSMFSALGIDIGTSAVPKYQDLSLKLNFPLNDGGNLSIWGISGKSDIDILISNQKDTSEVDLYGDNDRDQYFGTAMGIVGATYTKPINEKTYFKTTFSGSLDHQHTKHEYIDRVVNSEGQFDVLDVYDYMGFVYNTYKVSNGTFVNKKFGKKDVLKAGFTFDYYIASYHDSILANDTIKDVYKRRWDSDETFFLVQPYVQWKHKFSDDLIFTAGVHNQYFSLTNSTSILEPRAGLKWTANDKNTFSMGLGRHSQMQPLYTYFYQLGTGVEPHNKGMDFTRSNHAVLGYTRSISKNLAAKVETYYQNVSNVPVENDPSAFSLMNQGSGFSRLFAGDTLVNEGTGYNYGVEFTLEKYFSDSWHMMITGAVYNSRYKGSDGIERNTDFNGGYAANILGGREFELGDRKTLSIGGKVTFAGGKRYGLVDTVASDLQRELIYLDDQYNEFQFQDYFRADLKISFKSNAKKVTHEIALDLVNILDTQNILSLTYAPVPGAPNASPIRKNYQLGFLPIFYYKIDF